MFRVVWQYGVGFLGAIDDEAAKLRPLSTNAGAAPLAGIPLVGAPEPVFRRPPLTLRAGLLDTPEGFQADEANDLAGYHHAFLRQRRDAEALRDRLLNEHGVVYAEIQTRPEMPLWVDQARRIVAPQTCAATLGLHPLPTRDFEFLQVYLEAAPKGIDARYAWRFGGGRGDGIQIIDVERGWNFDHEDLREKQIGVITGVNEEHDHGTAVLGIFSGDRNAFGITGIAANAVAGAASATFDHDELKWNAADAIVTAASRLRPGDIILLEMHAPGPRAGSDPRTQKGFIAVEYWRPEFAAIRYAVQRGIHIVEAAGNGGEDLDHRDYKRRFCREHRDSGAIMVGAGASALQAQPRSRLSWSNYGSRLDVQGWGENIVTTGGRSCELYYDLVDHPDPSRCYTQSFGGTSGASPIVVGAVACINGCLKAAGRSVLSPGELRALLSDTGTPQTDGDFGPSSQRIGPLPNLREAIETLGLGS